VRTSHERAVSLGDPRFRLLPTAFRLCARDSLVSLATEMLLAFRRGHVVLPIGCYMDEEAL
jgi:hypothetical protein